MPEYDPQTIPPLLTDQPAHVTGSDNGRVVSMPASLAFGQPIDWTAVRVDVEQVAVEVH